MKEPSKNRYTFKIEVQKSSIENIPFLGGGCLSWSVAKRKAAPSKE